MINPSIKSTVVKYMPKSKTGKPKVRAFARLLSVSPTSVSNWVNDKSAPNISFLFDLRKQYSNEDFQYRFATDILNILVPGFDKPNGNGHKPNNVQFEPGSCDD